MTGRKLGRGLDMLIAKEPSAAKDEVLQLAPDSIQANPLQPRKRFAIQELEALKASVSRDGVLQPILVRKVGDSYQVVAGERRLRAARELGLERVPALLVSVGDDRLLEIALIENIQRENLNPIELAQAYRQLMEAKSWTQDMLAQALGLSRPGVANTIRLLELPEDMQGAIARGQISMGHAKVLLSITEPKEQRLLFERIAEEKLTVRDLEGAKDAIQSPDPATPVPAKGRKTQSSKSPHLASLEERFSERLGTRVRIREKAGKGRIAIDFYSADDFERIREILLGRSSDS